MRIGLVVLFFSACQVARPGERLFACEDGGRCPAGFSCSAEEGLCLHEGEVCTDSIQLDRDAGSGPFDVTVSADLSVYAHDQEATFCSTTPRGADVFYYFTGSGPFSATVTPIGNWKPVVTLQKCDLSVTTKHCGTTSLSEPELDPGFWRVVVSSETTAGGAFSLQVKASTSEEGDYCTTAVKLELAPTLPDGGLSAKASLDTSKLVAWTQQSWTSCGGALVSHDGIFRVPQRDAGHVTAKTSAPFRHWVQWRANNDNCTAATQSGCIEAVSQGDGGWRATLDSPSLGSGDAWLWVGAIGDGGVVDVQADLR